MFALSFTLLAMFTASGMSIIDICLDPIECEGDNSGSFMGNPKDCATYFVCIKQSLYPKNCLNGLLFDIVKNGCMDPKQSKHCQEKCRDSSYEKYVVHNPAEPSPNIPTTASSKALVSTTASTITTTSASSARPSSVEISSTHLTRITNDASVTSNPKLVEGHSSIKTSSGNDITTTKIAEVPASLKQYTLYSALTTEGSDILRSTEITSHDDTRTTTMTTTITTTTTAAATTIATTTAAEASSSSLEHNSSSPKVTSFEGSSSTTFNFPLLTNQSLSSSPSSSPTTNTGNIESMETTLVIVETSTLPSKTQTTSTLTSAIKPTILLGKVPDSEMYAEGSGVAFNCSFQINNAFVPVEVEDIMWLKNGMIIKNASFPSGRIFISNPVSLNDNTWSTRLVVTNARPYDGGSIKCRMNYKIDGKEDASEKSFNFQVIGRPKVLLEPQSLTLSGQNHKFSITCSVYGVGDDIATSYHWSVNGDSSISSYGLKSTTSNIGSILVGDSLDNDLNITCSVGKPSVISRNRTAYVYFMNANDKYCTEESSGIITKAGGQYILQCPRNNAGIVLRKCTEAGSWDEADDSDCLNEMLLELQDELDKPITFYDNDTSNDSFGDSIKNTLANIKEFLDRSDSTMNLQNLNMILGLINNFIHFRLRGTNSGSQEGIMLLMNIMGSILNKNDDLLLQLFKEDNGTVVSRVLLNVEDLARSMARSLPVGLSKTVDLPAMIVTVAALKAKEQPNMIFPASELNSHDFVSLEAESFESHGDENEVIFLSFASFKNLGKFLPNKDNRTINSSIISVVVSGNNSVPEKPINPVKFYYKALSALDSKKECYCSYWDLERNGWSQNGCQIMNISNSTYCQCDHLTNFALLMSLSSADDFNNNILSIISLIGCIISIASMILTLIIFAVRWRKIKTHHLVVIINLCIALIIANSIFLGGVNRTESKVGCVVVGALLHYFYLAAFFMMLAEGVELLMYIVFVFHVRRNRELVALIILAWACPLIVVAITLGVTKTVGYTSDKSCWLSLNHGVIWAFVGPVLTIILANVFILAVVVARIAGAKRPAEKDKARHRLRAAVWSVFFLTPVLGLTWVFGVLSVTKELIAFQYVFAIVNSLQGFFILIFHGLRNRKERPKYRYSAKESSYSNTIRQKALAYNRADRIASQSTASTSAGSHLGTQKSGSDTSSVFDSVIILDNLSLMNEGPADGFRKSRENGAFMPDIVEERAQSSNRDSLDSTNVNNSDNASAASSNFEFETFETPTQLRARQPSNVATGDKDRSRLSSC